MGSEVENAYWIYKLHQMREYLQVLWKKTISSEQCELNTIIFH